MRVFVATLRKLVRRPASWVTLGLTIALLGLILVSVGATLREVPQGPSRLASLALLSFPTAYVMILSFILGLGGLFGVLYAAAIAGSEWGWGTLKTAVARGESRWRYALATYGAVALMLGIGLLVAYVAGITTALLAGRLAGIEPTGVDDARVIGEIPEHVARSWLAIAEQGAIGFAIATLARSQLAGIGAGIGIYFGEQFATLFLPDVVRYLPFHVANAAVDLGGIATGDGGGAGAAGAMTPDQALGLTVAWLAGALLVACAFTDRADISG
jgi:ABC-type transport system involved in multi-copper enzyme maturation permease subunit